MRARICAVLAALPLVPVLALTGCGSDGGGSEVASANGATQDGGGASDAPLSDDEMYRMNLKYAQCLREHGVDVEDPAPGEGIQLQLDGDEKDKADAAMEACNEYAAPPPADDPDEEEVREDMLAFAQCMRENGVEKFADPKPGEGINVGPDVAEDPDFEKAQETCDEVFGGDGERAGGGRDA